MHASEENHMFSLLLVLTKATCEQREETEHTVQCQKQIFNNDKDEEVLQ